eukprot:7982709-Alexandrium_andersonii.AAC.1
MPRRGLGPTMRNRAAAGAGAAAVSPELTTMTTPRPSDPGEPLLLLAEDKPQRAGSQVGSLLGK